MASLRKFQLDDDLEQLQMHLEKQLILRKIRKLKQEALQIKNELLSLR